MIPSVNPHVVTMMRYVRRYIFLLRLDNNQFQNWKRSTVERSRRAAVNDKVREIVTVGPLEVFKPNDDDHARENNHSSAGGSFGWIAAGLACTAFIAYIVYQKRDHKSNEVSPEVL